MAKFSKLVDLFLLPALNKRKYGSLLQWINCRQRTFEVYWEHKNSFSWSPACNVVFSDWDRLKGHYHPEVTDYFLKSKQRFKAALMKCGRIKELSRQSKWFRRFKFFPRRKFQQADGSSNRSGVGTRNPGDGIIYVLLPPVEKPQREPKPANVMPDGFFDPKLSLNEALEKFLPDLSDELEP